MSNRAYPDDVSPALMIYYPHGGQYGSFLNYLNEPMTLIWNQPWVQERYPTVIVALKRSVGEIDYLREKIDFLQAVIDQCHVDRNRIYVLGASLGCAFRENITSWFGFHPAAVIPADCENRRKVLPFIKETPGVPFWYFVGANAHVKSCVNDDGDKCINYKYLQDSIIKINGEPAIFTHCSDYSDCLGISHDTIDSLIQQGRKYFISSFQYQHHGQQLSRMYNEHAWQIIEWTYNQSADIPELPPETPSGLISEANFCDEISLSWDDNSFNESIFKVERKENNGPFQYIGSTYTNINSFTDRTVLPDAVYTYRLRSYNPAGYSGYSNEVDITTRKASLKAPGLTAITLNSDSVLIYITSVTGAEKYQIEKKLQVQDKYEILAEISDTIFFHTIENKETNIRYRCKAINGYQESNYSGTSQCNVQGGYLYAYDDFDYDDVNIVEQVNYGIGWEKPWKGVNCTFTLKNSLNITGLPERGNSLDETVKDKKNIYSFAERKLSQSISTDSIFWISMIWKPTIYNLHNGFRLLYDDETYFALQKSNLGDYWDATPDGQIDDDNMRWSGKGDNTQKFWLLKFERINRNMAKATLWKKSQLESYPGNSTDTVVIPNFKFNKIRFSLAPNGYVFDDIRIGSTYQDVIGNNPAEEVFTKRPKPEAPEEPVIDTTYLFQPDVDIVVKDIAVDGNESDWDGVQKLPLGLTAGEDFFKDENDINAWYKLAFDNTSLYLFFQITDDKAVIYKDENVTSHPDAGKMDNIEIFLDMDHSQSVGFDGMNDFMFRILRGIDVQPGDSVGPDILGNIPSVTNLPGTNSMFEYQKGLIEGLELQIVPVENDNGYRLEIAIPWEMLTRCDDDLSIKDFNDGTILGFAVQITDRDDFDMYDVTKLKSVENHQSNIPLSWGSATLTGTVEHEQVSSYAEKSVAPENIFVYPNPVDNDYVYIKKQEKNKAVFYKLSDIHGKIVSQGWINSNSIKVSQFERGMYVLHLFTDGNFFVQKLIIQ